eukprot:CAMPEP_0197002430 /NCGR_PEP_ID=MMETSP1380-20130617/6916_1 /TAXON_ID=5936 /ORGANISM="Euplotes crassus, Strain CT5" /LENGTH=232 /DNA_ID=CAMNT_0042420531 /DNA_START=154 /DNA_END=850 /DNA_ORIENTATION=+
MSAYKLSSLIKKYNPRDFQFDIDNYNRTELDLSDLEEKYQIKKDIDALRLNERAGRRPQNIYGADPSFTFNKLSNTFENTSRNSKSKLSRMSSNSTKCSLHFKTVTREKCKKRAYFDWNNQPSLLINQNEIETNKATTSHTTLPESGKTHRGPREESTKDWYSNRVESSKFVVSSSSEDKLKTPFERRQELELAKQKMGKIKQISQELGYNQKKNRVLMNEYRSGILGVDDP